MKYYDEKLNINIIYSFQSSSKNFIYYKCKRRPKCPGTAKMNIKTKEFEITRKCDINIEHDLLNYEQFKILYKNKDFIKLDLLNKKYQRFILKSLLLKMIIAIYQKL